MATKTVEARTVKIEAVTSKSKFPKFNLGAILVDGKWINVARRDGLDMNMFEKLSTMDLDIETNEKGYETVVGVNKLSTASKVPAAVVTSTPSQTAYHTADELKSKRIIRQGAIQSGYKTLGMSGLTGDELRNAARQIADDIVDYTVNG